jgi:hypothetical protein
MDIKMFWQIIKELDEAVTENEWEQLKEEIYNNKNNIEAYTNIHKKYSNILDKFCNNKEDIKIFIAIYDKYYELLDLKYFCEYPKENATFNIKEGYYIAFLIMQGINNIRKIYRSPSEEIINLFENSYKHKWSDIQIFINDLKGERIGLSQDEQGRIFYKGFELTYELNKEIEDTL